MNMILAKWSLKMNGVRITFCVAGQRLRHGCLNSCFGRWQLNRCLAALGMAVLSQVSPAQTITDNFTDPTKWGAVTQYQGSGTMSLGSGRMNYTSTSTEVSGAAIPRTAMDLPTVSILSTTQDWSLKVDAHLDQFELTTEYQFSDVFLGFGKTGDEVNTGVLFEFGRGWWGSHNGYYIGF